MTTSTFFVSNSVLNNEITTSIIKTEATVFSASNINVFLSQKQLGLFKNNITRYQNKV